jgi:hypothetical protein
MPQKVRNSFKTVMLFAVYHCMGLEFTSFEMSSVASVLGFTPDTTMMNLMRYAKHGLLNRRREGHEYVYWQNERTERAYIYFFGSVPPFVTDRRMQPGQRFPIELYFSTLKR